MRRFFAMRCELRDIVEDFDILLGRAADIVKKCSVRASDAERLYSILGHMAANISAFSEVVDKVACGYEVGDKNA